MLALLLQILGLLAVVAGGFVVGTGAGIICAGLVAVYVGLSIEVN